MGGQQSNSKVKEYEMMCDSFTYAPTSSHRTEATYHARFKEENTYVVDNGLVDRPKQLLRTPFWGEWSMTFADGVCPEPRNGQCSVYDPETNSLIIAYGCNERGQYLNDAWSLSLHPLRWQQISKQLLSPREYCSSVLIGRRMFIFGGAFEHEFYSDLHYIDLATGELTMVQTTGDQPTGRTSPAFFATKDFIYMWGGYDGRSHGELYSLDIANLKWKHFPKDTTGVPAPAYCSRDGDFYIFGGMTGTSLSKLETDTGNLIPFQCTGAEPHRELAHSALISVDSFLFLIGGEYSSKHMNIYALDLKRRWWFAFHVRPDGLTTTTSDGNVGAKGNFQLPREHSASVIYSKKDREIVSVMGSKLINSSPIFKLKIGNALASIHLSSDMLDLLVFDQQKRTGL